MYFVPSKETSYISEKGFVLFFSCHFPVSAAEASGHISSTSVTWESSITRAFCFQAQYNAQVAVTNLRLKNMDCLDLVSNDWWHKGLADWQKPLLLGALASIFFQQTKLEKPPNRKYWQRFQTAVGLLKKEKSSTSQFGSQRGFKPGSSVCEILAGRVASNGLMCVFIRGALKSLSGLSDLKSSAGAPARTSPVTNLKKTPANRC